MNLIEEERVKINSNEVKELEKTLDVINIEERRLIDEFDKNALSILGPNLYNEIIKITGSNKNLLLNFHKSSLINSLYYDEYYYKLSNWFTTKTLLLKSQISKNSKEKDLEKLLPGAFALSSLALTSFHKNKNMYLHDVQKLASIAIFKGDIAELATGEGKTLSAILPVFLHALRGKGAHVVTANAYLAKRDYEEVKPIFEALGLTIGYVPSYTEEDAIEMKKIAYAADVTYAEKSEVAFDYLRDSIANRKEEIVSRKERGFALIDEVDDALIDDAKSPYVIAGKENAIPYGKKEITIQELSKLIDIPIEKILSTLIRLNYPMKKDTFNFREAASIAEVYGIFLTESAKSYRIKAANFYNTIKKDRLSEEEIDNINTILKKYPDLFTYKGRTLKTSNRFLYDLLTINTIDDEETSPLYKKLSVQEVDSLRKTFGVIVKDINNNEDIYVTDKMTEIYTDYVFLNDERVIDVLKKHQEEIKEELTRLYGNSNRYMTIDGKITLSGYQKIKKDNPNFFKENIKELDNLYKNLSDNRTITLATMVKYLNNTILAEEIFVKDKDYKVKDNMVLVLKNDRVLEGSKYADGLQEAIEIKEGVPTNEETTRLREITQKDFYMLYDSFSGMTGTSSKSIFREIFGKETISLPRNVYYEYSKGKTNEKPVGVEKKDVKFTMDQETKFSLILKSIINSINNNPKEPVLIVVSNPNEIYELYNYLSSRIPKDIISVLDSSTVSFNRALEANIISTAGIPGRITISTELVGRGTDIRLGGDRDTIINNATDNAIEIFQKTHKKVLTNRELMRYRKIVEEKLVKEGIIYSEEEELRERELLKKTGLKVISSGYFDSERIDRQLDGRTGRNGQGGTTEKYASLDDLISLGVLDVGGKSVREFFNKGKISEDGSLDFENRKELMTKIREVQKKRDDNISENIKYAQTVTKVYLNKQNDYVNKRFDLLELDPVKDRRKINELVNELIEDTVDLLITSYTNISINKKNVLRNINDKEDNIDIEGLMLACKEYFNVDIDVNLLKNTEFNILEFRNALISYTRRIHDEMNKRNPNQTKLDLEALLLSNKYMLVNLPYLSNSVLTERGLDPESNANKAAINFAEESRSLKYESSKIGIRFLFGRFLGEKEQEIIDSIRNDRFNSNDVGTRPDSVSVESLRKSKEEIEEKLEKGGRFSNLNIDDAFFINVGRKLVLVKEMINSKERERNKIY